VELKVGSVVMKVFGKLPNDLASGGAFAVGGTPGLPVKPQAAHQNMIYKEVNIVGHPAASVAGMLSGRACPSDAKALNPYFLSSLDSAAWRWSIPEIVYPQSWIPGLREIGQFPFYTWGAVYPRGGFGTQTDDVKLAAVTAQRAADVVTRKSQPHLYQALGPGTENPDYKHGENQEIWVPGQLTEGETKMGRWQMISPKLDQKCTVFGKNDLISPTGWGGGKVSGNGAYSWILWRPYQCCETKGIFIATTPLEVYPPKDDGVGDQGASSSTP
jgi:integrating conjugative element protein (TIGR03756 family)